MGFKVRYRLHMKAFNFKKPNPSQRQSASLEILTRQRLQFLLRTPNNHAASSSPSLIVVDDVVSPMTTNRLVVPPRVIASSALCRLCVRKALESLEMDGWVRGHVGPAIERYTMQVAKAVEKKGVGVENFGVVVLIEVIKADVLGQEACKQFVGSEIEHCLDLSMDGSLI